MRRWMEFGIQFLLALVRALPLYTAMMSGYALAAGLVCTLSGTGNNWTASMLICVAILVVSILIFRYADRGMDFLMNGASFISPAHQTPLRKGSLKILLADVIVLVLVFAGIHFTQVNFIETVNLAVLDAIPTGTCSEAGMQTVFGTSFLTIWQGVLAILYTVLFHYLLSTTAEFMSKDLRMVDARRGD